MLHIRRGKALKRPVQPSPACSPRLRRLPPPCGGAAFDVARGAARRVTASRASPRRLILSARAARSCGFYTRSRTTSGPPSPSQIRVRGARRKQIITQERGRRDWGGGRGGIYLHTCKRCTAALNAGTLHEKTKQNNASTKCSDAQKEQ